MQTERNMRIMQTNDKHRRINETNGKCELCKRNKVNVRIYASYAINVMYKQINDKFEYSVNMRL